MRMHYLDTLPSARKGRYRPQYFVRKSNASGQNRKVALAVIQGGPTSFNLLRKIQ